MRKTLGVLFTLAVWLSVAYGLGSLLGGNLLSLHETAVTHGQEQLAWVHSGLAVAIVVALATAAAQQAWKAFLRSSK